MIKALSEINPGETCVVKEIRGDPRYVARLRDFGMIAGSELICRYCSPGKHLLAVECGGSVVALRRTDVSRIQVKI